MTQVWQNLGALTKLFSLHYNTTLIRCTTILPLLHCQCKQCKLFIHNRKWNEYWLWR